MLKKLRLKFVLINMGIIAVMLCVILGMMYHSTRVNLEQESIRTMQQIAQRPTQTVPPGEDPEAVRVPYFALQLSKGGELMAVNGNYFDLSDTQTLEVLIEAALTSGEEIGTLHGHHLRFLKSTTPSSQKLVFVDITAEENTLENLLKTCIAVGIIASAAFLGVSILLAKWAVRPVEKAWKQQRQFVSDASHELKTPLTVIMTNAELLQNPTYDADSKNRFADSIFTMSRQMQRLVEQMLELARSDNAQKHMAYTKVDLSELTQAAILPFEPVFFERGMTLSSVIQPDVQAMGSPEQLRQVLEILLDNAQKYASQGGHTQVQLVKTGKNRCLWLISNQGAPIAPEELENLFKRFYRADEARSRTGSFGLGLSIAQSIVQQHRGRIWAQSRDGYNTFFVELPIMG